MRSGGRTRFQCVPLYFDDCVYNPRKCIGGFWQCGGPESASRYVRRPHTFDCGAARKLGAVHGARAREAQFYHAVTWRRFWSQYRRRDSPAPPPLPPRMLRMVWEMATAIWRRCRRPFIHRRRPTPIDYALAFAQMFLLGVRSSVHLSLGFSAWPRCSLSASLTAREQSMLASVPRCRAVLWAEFFLFREIPRLFTLTFPSSLFRPATNSSILSKSMFSSVSVSLDSDCNGCTRMQEIHCYFYLLLRLCVLCLAAISVGEIKFI